MASYLSMARRSFMIAAPALLLYAALAQGAKPTDAVRILYPASRTVHVGPVSLIAATPIATKKLPATLDGKPISLRRLTFSDTWQMTGLLKSTDALVGDRTTTALWAAELTMTPGPHIAVIGGKRIELRGAKDSKAIIPAGYTITYAHKALTLRDGKIDCGSCHERTGDTLGEVRTPKVCAPCHDETSVQLIHSHVPQPLNNCAMCHDPHGSPRPKLLLDAKAKLCSKCHSAGHIK